MDLLFRTESLSVLSITKMAPHYDFVMHARTSITNHRTCPVGASDVLSPWKPLEGLRSIFHNYGVSGKREKVFLTVSTGKIYNPVRSTT